MPEFAKPTGFSFDVERELELGALNQHREARDIPPKEEDRLLLATWNLANFEVQDREAVHLDLIGEIVGWFDLIALQEIRDDLSGLRALRARLLGVGSALQRGVWQRRASSVRVRQREDPSGGEGR